MKRSLPSALGAAGALLVHLLFVGALTYGNGHVSIKKEIQSQLGQSMAGSGEEPIMTLIFLDGRGESGRRDQPETAPSAGNSTQLGAVAVASPETANQIISLAQHSE